MHHSEMQHATKTRSMVIIHSSAHQRGRQAGHHPGLHVKGARFALLHRTLSSAPLHHHCSLPPIVVVPVILPGNLLLPPSRPRGVGPRRLPRHVHLQCRVGVPGRRRGGGHPAHRCQLRDGRRHRPRAWRRLEARVGDRALLVHTSTLGSWLLGLAKEILNPGPLLGRGRLQTCVTMSASSLLVMPVFAASGGGEGSYDA